MPVSRRRRLNPRTANKNRAYRRVLHAGYLQVLAGVMTRANYERLKRFAFGRLNDVPPEQMAL